jgi:tetratricopeptide (TPR) repeat protein
MLLARAGKLPQAEQHLREALRLNPDFQTYQDLALVLTAAGQPEAAVAQYKEALRLRPDSAIVLNNLAWILAASPSETVRNGSEAVKLAEQACQLTRFQQPIFIGTLAAAYAEARQFQDAINTAEKAIAVASSAGQKDVAERNQQLLELYRVGKPFHEAPSK